MRGEDGIAQNGPVMTHARIVAELREKSRKAALRGKPVMWAYYGDMADSLVAEFANAKRIDGGYAGCALAISQNAEDACRAWNDLRRTREQLQRRADREMRALWGGRR